jgi:flagellar biogenesis protein FliO
MAEQPRDDGRNSPAQTASDADKVKAAATTAATGAGCLATALMPGTLIVVVLVIVFVVWVAWKFISAPS